MAALSKLLSKHREEIQQIVEKHHAKNVRVFGSVASNTDVEGSDIDLISGNNSRNNTV